MKNKNVGYKFIKYGYDGGLYSEVKGASVEMTFPYQDCTWTELLEVFQDFLKASGFHPPNGEITWLEEGEIVCTKAEAVLYGEPRKEEE